MILQKKINPFLVDELIFQIKNLMLHSCQIRFYVVGFARFLKFGVFLQRINWSGFDFIIFRFW